MKITVALSFCIYIAALFRSHADELTQRSLRSPELAAQPQVSTTLKQRQQIVRTTRSLEKASFRLGATTDREAALWIIDHAPDIFPRLQDRITSDISSSGVPDWRPIYAQFIFGFVSFQLEEPAKADDPLAAYQAALTSCLQVYRQAMQRDSTNRLAFLDTANEHERGGTLQQYVARLVAELPAQRAK